MDNKKFEKLIDLVINENEEQARELFHEIVVEKSREIYESIMDEEMMADSMHDDMEESEMVGEVGDLISEIQAEEAGMTEEEELDDVEEGMMDGVMEDEEEELDDEEDEEEYDLDSDEDSDEDSEEDLEDRVVDLEDKLEELMAEFEQLLGQEEAGEEGPEAPEGGEEVEMDDEEEEVVAEAVQLQKVSVTHGDNGSNTKSPVSANSGKTGMGSNPVKFSGASESVPTGPKGASNPYAKGQKEVEGASKFGNTPGQKGRKLENAPKPTTSQASGVNTKSPLAK